MSHVERQKLKMENTREFAGRRLLSYGLREEIGSSSRSQTARLSLGGSGKERKK